MTIRFTRILAIAGVAAATALLPIKAADHLNLAGNWQVTLDSNPAPADITLPGTTDIARLGSPIADTTETTRLSRPFSFKGKARYERDIEVPAQWRTDSLYLLLERTKPATVFIDGIERSYNDNISTPQLHNLGVLAPGRHRLEVVVDNASGVPEQLYASSHAYCEDTQTNWNGIIGEISLLNGRPEASVRPDSVLPAFRDFHIEGKHFYADGAPVFLRGRVDNCVWPLTAHVPMDEETWTRYLQICKDYGLNHIRFHSWCPPEAAFRAADKLGIYLQPELPFWGSFDAADKTLMDFLHKEGMNILKTYGHHPSFVMFALGNELWGDIDKMQEFVADFRQVAPDKLYTLGSNYFLGYQGVKPGMDYFTTCRVGGEGWGNFNTHTRGSFSFADAYDGGIINHFHPGTEVTLDEGCSLSTVPVISHETAQFQIYPDYREMEKYTGALYPYNMEQFRERLEMAGMADQAAAFHGASGKWAVELYKADMELDLRTREMAGFQLLDLQDYPGQGSAYVGILDAFMDSKGLVTPESWRQSCGDVVPLAILPKYCFSADEPMPLGVKIANYGGKSLSGMKLDMSLQEPGAHHSLWQETQTIASDSLGLFEAAATTMQPDKSDQARRLQLHIAIVDKGDTLARNSYPIWIYPAKQDVDSEKGKVIITRRLTNDICRKLEAGASVLLMPDSTQTTNTVGGLFITDYWNYRMFKTISENNNKEVSPGTLGILTDPQHPLFNSFPTEEHSNWQWWPVVKASTPMMLDNTGAAYRPIVQVIDNVERNHKLGLVFEFAMGKGKLLVVMSDLEEASEYPEGKQFLLSALRYMNSPEFSPATAITADQLRQLLTTEVKSGEIGILNNISPY